MFLTRSLKAPARSRSRRAPSPRVRFRPAIEGLEAREVPAIFTVTTTADVLEPNDGVLSLREAVLQANATNGADTINVPAGLHTLSLAGADEDAAATGDLDLTGTVRIVGDPAGGTVVDAAGLDRVFHVLSDGTATLERLTIRGGRTAFAGGGVVNEGSLTVDACAVVGNATGLAGGGIINLGQLTVLSSAFEGNTVSGFSFGLGGGISNSGSLTVRQSTFRGNIAAGRFTDEGGGAISSEFGDVNIDECSFAGNSALGSGGALLVVNRSGLSDSNTKVTIRSSTFDDNHARYGGAVDLYERGRFTTTTVTGCNFTNNSGAVTGGGWGGAISSGLGKLAVTDCLFSGNSSQVAGAIYCVGEAAIRNSRFLSNTAVESGGALFGYGNQSVSGCTFTGNHAEMGGALVGVGTVLGSTFTGNTASYGGAIYGAGVVSDSLIASNTAAYGGGIYNPESMPLTVRNCTIVNNSADYGGGIANFGSLTLRDSSVIGNTARLGGDLYNIGQVFLFDSTVGDRYDG